MGILRNIVEDRTAPRTTDLWLDGLRIKAFKANGWISLTGLVTDTDKYGIVVNPDARNKSEGFFAMSSGRNTYAKGDESATFNNNTVANNTAESSFGNWNKSNESDDKALATLFSVGTGNGLLHKNGFEVMQNGDIYVEGIGNYNGRNPEVAQTLQQVVKGTTGGGVIDTAGTFDASPLKGATTITEEFKAKLLDAVKLHKLVYITYADDSGTTYQSAVVYAGFDKDSIKLTTYNNESTDIFTITLADNSVKEESCNYTFFMTNDKAKLESNKLLASQILFERSEDVRIKGVHNGIDYNIIGVYKDGYITAVQEGQVKYYSVNFNTGELEDAESECRLVNYVMLDKGNDPTIKAANLEKLRKNTGNFLVSFDYGYGVGEFIDGEGGIAHITTPKGYEVFYNITSEGELIQNDNYIKPNDPYTVILDGSKIGTILDDVTGSQVAKAGELVVMSSAGPVTYTRTIDSNKNVVYFTDDDRNGEVIRLTYMTSTKRIDSAIVPIKAATQASIGGIKQGKYIDNVSSAFEAVDRFNELLTELRNIGVLAQQ